jgi:hypothetical protein
MASTDSARKTSSNQLSCQISMYALAAASAGVSVLALAQPAEGQIIYTPVHKVTSHNSTIAIDFNNDGTIDLGLRQSTYRTAAGLIYELKAVPTEGVGLLCSRFGCPAPLKGGAEIGPTREFKNIVEPLAGWATAYDGTLFGAWYLNINKYQFLGVKFLIQGEVHYGWVRLKADTWTGYLTGFAYETEANTPITAGDTGSADDGEAPAVSDNPGTAMLERKPETGLGVLALGASGLRLWR